MREIQFSVPLTGVIKIAGNTVTVTVNRTTTNVIMEAVSGSPNRSALDPEATIFDILLESAQEFYRRMKYNRFTGGDLYNIARESHPDLNKRSFLSRLTAATPNAPSYRHHLSHRDYFSRTATGVYSLEDRYLPKDEGPAIEEAVTAGTHIALTAGIARIRKQELDSHFANARK